MFLKIFWRKISLVWKDDESVFFAQRYCNWCLKNMLNDSKKILNNPISQQVKKYMNYINQFRNCVMLSGIKGITFVR
jgi:hypothetical protein